MLRITEVPPHNVYEGRIALGGPNGSEMSHQPNRAADHPEAEAKTDRGGERAVDDTLRGSRPNCRKVGSASRD
jgi:hypothetical protein